MAKKLPVVAITWDMGKAFLETVQAAFPDLDVRDVSKASREEFGLTRRGLVDSPALKELAKTVEWGLAEAEVAVSARLPYRFFERAPKVRWVQFVGAGVDFMLPKNAASLPVVFTNVSGAIAVPMAEAAVTLMLALSKGYHIFARAQALGRWAVRHEMEGEGRRIALQGRTVAILGVGAIGTEVARLCKAFQMTVLGTRRSCMERQQNVGYVDEMVPPREVGDIVSRADFVVATMPLTPETEHLINRDLMRKMKKSAFLVNVGRGGVIDEKEMIRELKLGTFAGAGLDVFEEEPLPPESDLWYLPNVIITPHVGGGAPAGGGGNTGTAKIFCENLRRYVAGEPLMNVVDKELRY